MHDIDRHALQQLEQQSNLSRKQRRYIKREIRAQRYRAVALAGGGPRECLRRCRQIANRFTLELT